MKGIRNITEWEKENSFLDSEWGKITYGEWCKKESARMNSKGGDVEVIRTNEGIVCIARKERV